MARTVTAPMVSVLSQGGRVFHLSRGDVLPADVSGGSLKNLVSLGFVSEDVNTLPAPEPEPEGDGDGEDKPARRGPGRPRKSE